MKAIALIFMLSALAFCQTGPATTKGTCSPANSGSNNTFNVTCTGLTQAQQRLLESVPAILNKLLAAQADNTSEILSRLDTCVTGVQLVREQQADWRLNEEQITRLKKRVTGTRAKATFNFLPSDRNSGLISTDIVAALQNDWDLQPGGPNFTLPPTLVGIVLIANHKDFPELATLKDALHDVGIEAVVEIDQEQKWVKDKGLIFIAVGAKPPVKH